jgi:RNA polymerase sigma-70 factor (ECF subfamily)
MDEIGKLYEKARDGDGDAFWQLVLPHRGLVYSVAYGILKDHERAEDQLHDILLHAFRSIGGLRDPDRLPSWLYSLARNRVLDLLRREQRARRAVFNAARETRVIPMSEMMEQETWLRRMESAMADLPEPFREILALKYMSHYSVLRIAEILDISEPAVKSRLFQARKTLRRLTEDRAAAEAGGTPAGKEKER